MQLPRSRLIYNASLFRERGLHYEPVVVAVAVVVAKPWAARGRFPPGRR